MVKWFAFHIDTNYLIKKWSADYFDIHRETQRALKVAAKADQPVFFLDRPEVKLDMAIFTKGLGELGVKILICRMREPFGSSLVVRALPGVELNIKKIMQFAGLFCDRGSKAKCYMRDYQLQAFRQVAIGFCR